ncbi:MAG: hypothetical protein ABL953_02870 [Ilumatobacteraceae bacterium]
MPASVDITAINRRLKSSWSVGLAAGLIAFAFVGLRLLIAADGDVSKFVVAGHVHTNAAEVRPTIHVFETDGYDGQFYWRLATNPSELDSTPYRGVQFDSSLRVSRIGYPTIAWAIAFGQPELAKWTLVLANIVAIAVLAASGASIARSRGRPAFIGFAFASPSGLVMSLSRDLCEVTMIAALIAGVALMSRRQYGWATVSWMIACLVHEQSLFLVIPYGAYRLVQMIRARRFAPAVEDAPWLAGIAVFGLWQLAGKLLVGSFPVLASGSASMDVPFKGLVHQANHWLHNGFGGGQQYLIVPQLALMIVLIVLAFRSGATLKAEDRWLSWALVTAAVLASGLSSAVWVGPAELRHVVVLTGIAWLVIVMSGRRIPITLAAATGAVWLMTATLRAAAI